MPVFKAVNGKYESEKDLKHLVKYAIRKDHCIEEVYGAQGVALDTGDNMYKQMKDVRQYYHKNTKRYALHYVLSFDEREMKYIDSQKALALGYQIAEYFWRWQIVFGIHTNTDNLHIHFVVNSISYENGASISVGLVDLQRIQSIADNFVKNCYAATLPEKERFEYQMSRFQ